MGLAYWPFSPGANIVVPNSKMENLYLVCINALHVVESIDANISRSEINQDNFDKMTLLKFIDNIIMVTNLIFLRRKLHVITIHLL